MTRLLCGILMLVVPALLLVGGLVWVMWLTYGPIGIVIGAGTLLFSVVMTWMISAGIESVSEVW